MGAVRGSGNTSSGAHLPLHDGDHWVRGASWTGRHFTQLFQLLSLSQVRKPAEGSAKPQEDVTLVNKMWLWPPAPGNWVWPEWLNWV